MTNNDCPPLPHEIPLMIHNLLRNLSLLSLLALLSSAELLAQQDASDEADSIAKLRVLIVDGQNNHAAWPQTTAMMKQYLEETGRFAVDIARTQYTWKGGERLQEYGLADGKTYQDLDQPRPDPDFQPDFEKYDAVVNNFGWKAALWPEETREAFERYMEQG